MALVLLVLTGLSEVGRAVGLKYTEGCTRLWPTGSTAGSMVGNLLLLGLALRSVPLRTGYESGLTSTHSAP